MHVHRESEESEDLGPEPGGRWSRWAAPGYLYDTSSALSRLLALATAVSLPVPGRKKARAASGTSCWRISLECRVGMFELQVLKPAEGAWWHVGPHALDSGIPLPSF